MDSIFKGIFDSDIVTVISPKDFIFCICISLVAGLIMALCYMFKTRYTKSFIFTLALLPSVVCVVIMMVNGNVGAGVAVAGAFSLVRFRSAPGSAKEIVTLFLAMAAGLIAGMGYLVYALLFTVIMCIMLMVYNLLDFGTKKHKEKYKNIRITIPEDLDYTGVFDEIFERYTKEYELTGVKTTNMGSMFRLTYDIVLLDVAKEKELIDELRVRNGNLEITVSKQAQNITEL
ncbi:MAG: DUF4956 domain-containing protein [Clostridia bacterium]|nr:DUF4956 domain-containing protein [Clostridia bacterium]